MTNENLKDPKENPNVEAGEKDKEEWREHFGDLAKIDEETAEKLFHKQIDNFFGNTGKNRKETETLIEEIGAENIENLRSISEKIEEEDMGWVVSAISKIRQRAGEGVVMKFKLEDMGLIQEIAQEKGMNFTEGITKEDTDEIARAFIEKMEAGEKRVVGAKETGGAIQPEIESELNLEKDLKTKALGEENIVLKKEIDGLKFEINYKAEGSEDLNKKQEQKISELNDRVAELNKIIIDLRYDKDNEMAELKETIEALTRENITLKEDKLATLEPTEVAQEAVPKPTEVVPEGTPESTETARDIIPGQSVEVQKETKSLFDESEEELENKLDMGKAEVDTFLEVKSQMGRYRITRDHYLEKLGYKIRLDKNKNATLYDKDDKELRNEKGEILTFKAFTDVNKTIETPLIKFLREKVRENLEGEPMDSQAEISPVAEKGGEDDQMERVPLTEEGLDQFFKKMGRSKVLRKVAESYYEDARKFGVKLAKAMGAATISIPLTPLAVAEAGGRKFIWKPAGEIQSWVGDIRVEGFEKRFGKKIKELNDIREKLNKAMEGTEEEISLKEKLSICEDALKYLAEERKNAKESSDSGYKKIRGKNRLLGHLHGLREWVHQEGEKK